MKQTVGKKLSISVIRNRCGESDEICICIKEYVKIEFRCWLLTDYPRPTSCALHSKLRREAVCCSARERQVSRDVVTSDWCYPKQIKGSAYEEFATVDVQTRTGPNRYNIGTCTQVNILPSISYSPCRTLLTTNMCLLWGYNSIYNSV